MWLLGPPNIQKLKQKRNINALVKALTYKKDPNIRKWAADALGELGEKQAVAPLIAALDDQETDVKCSAAAALGKLGDPRAVEPLIKSLEDILVRKSAARVLQRLGKVATPGLLAALEHDNKDVRRYVAEILGNLEDPTAVEPLIKSLGDDDSSVRRSVATALGNLGDLRAVQPLIKLLKDGNTDAVTPLGQLGDPQAVQPLLNALSKKQHYTTQNAIKAALHKLDDAAIPYFLAALDHDDKAVRRYASEQLDRLGWEPRRDKDKIRYYLAREHYASLAKLGPVAVDALINDLVVNDSGRAAWALGETGDPSAVEPLIAALKSTDKELQRSSAMALGKIGDTRATEPLMALFKKGNWRLKKMVADVLGKIGDASATDMLIKALKRKNWQIQRASVIALGKIGDARAVNPIIDLLHEQKDLFVILASAQALGNIGDARATEALDSLVEDENWLIREAALRALHRIGGPELKERYSKQVTKVSRDVKIKYFANELKKIAQHQSLLGGTSRNFNEQGRNYRAILIGEEVNRIGGIKWMRAVWHEFAKLSKQGRKLEVCWGGIGEWLG